MTSSSSTVHFSYFMKNFNLLQERSKPKMQKQEIVYEVTTFQKGHYKYQLMSRSKYIGVTILNFPIVQASKKLDDINILSAI